eukprot:7473263-Alexandrium_andersonii.AAC.1
MRGPPSGGGAVGPPHLPPRSVQMVIGRSVRCRLGSPDALPHLRGAVNTLEGAGLAPPAGRGPPRLHE